MAPVKDSMFFGIATKQVSIFWHYDHGIHESSSHSLRSKFVSLLGIAFAVEGSVIRFK